MYSGTECCKEERNPEPGYSLDYMRNRIDSIYRDEAFKIADTFAILDKLTEEEFITIMKTLDGRGMLIGDAIEKFRKYKSL